MNELPDAYRRFLETHSDDVSYEYDDLDSWYLATQQEFASKRNIDGAEYDYPNQLVGYVASARVALGGDSTTDDNDESYAWERLAQGIAIGENNGDILYLDPSDEFSVWCFYHDGADVERLEDSFADWLANATIETDD